MRKDKIIYSLSIIDIQNVSNEILGRKLDDDEIIKTISEIEKSINWFDVIEDAIISVINMKESE